MILHLQCYINIIGSFLLVDDEGQQPLPVPVLDLGGGGQAAFPRARTGRLPTRDGRRHATRRLGRGQPHILNSPSVTSLRANNTRRVLLSVTQVLDAVAALRDGRPESGVLKLWSNYVTGEDLFGLTEPAVVRVLESLPGQS